MDRPRKRRYSVRVLVLALLASGCGPEGPETDSDCASVSQALYNGTSDSGGLGLSPAQMNAIVAVETIQGAHLCTGTLIERDWVLTAAHCHVANELYLTFSTDTKRLISGRMALHPVLDLMLIEITPPDCGACGSCASPIPLWEGSIGDDWQGMPVTLSGSGLTEDGSVGERRFAEEHIADIRPTEIWVDGRGRTGACGGDSGGPLLAREGGASVRVLGILDRGSQNCLGLDVYTRSDVLKPWAQDTVAAL